MCSCFSARQKTRRAESLSKSIKLNLDEKIILGSDGAISFSVDDISEATGNFSPSRKIGQGGFGTVYYGKLRDGTPIAVKRAKKAVFEARLCADFRSELETLSKIEHLNLARLYGYVETKDERALVFEYVPNGNLREHLDGLHGTILPFATRVDILVDIAHALTYLHYYADEPIIHRDVKSSNILLTKSFRAKVTDFGFSRVGPMDNAATHVSTQVKGTAGYLDPEYLCTKQLTPRSDVYSFGILMVETLSGRRPIELKRTGDERITIRWAWKMFEGHNTLEMLDPKLERHQHLTSTVDRLTELAFHCAAYSRRERPSMQDVSKLLFKIRKDMVVDPSQSSSDYSSESYRTVSNTSHHTS